VKYIQCLEELYFEKAEYLDCAFSNISMTQNGQNMYDKMFDHEAGTSTHDALMVDTNKDEAYEFNDAPQFSLSACLLRTFLGFCGAFSMYVGFVIGGVYVFASDSGNESAFIMKASFITILGMNVCYSGCDFMYSAYTGLIGSWWNIWDIIKEHTIYYMVCVVVWVPLTFFTALLLTSLFGDGSVLFVVVVSLGLATYVYTSILQRESLLFLSMIAKIASNMICLVSHER